MAAQPSQAPLQAAAALAFGVPTFTKIDAAGNALPLDAPSWAAVRVALGAAAFDVLPGYVQDRRMAYAEAAPACAALDALGSRDWRPPTIRELKAILSIEHSDPATDPAFFPDTRSAWHWSSTPHAASPSDYAWGVYFNNGFSGWNHQDSTGFVRAVRSVAVPVGQ